MSVSWRQWAKDADRERLEQMFLEYVELCDEQKEILGAWEVMNKDMIEYERSKRIPSRRTMVLLFLGGAMYVFGGLCFVYGVTA